MFPKALSIILTITPWMSFLTLAATSGGWLDASLISVEKKFLHFFFATSGDIFADTLADGPWAVWAVVVASGDADGAIVMLWTAAAGTLTLSWEELTCVWTGC